MFKASEFVERFRSYLIDLGYGERTIITSDSNSLKFMDVDFSFSLQDRKKCTLLSLTVEGGEVLEGLDRKIAEIEDGTFWERNLSHGAVESMRGYSAYLNGIKIRRENAGYVFEALLETDILDDAFMAVFNYFIRPSLFCAREKKR